MHASQWHRRVASSRSGGSRIGRRAAGEIDFALIAFDGVDPSAPQVTALAGGAADPRAVFGAAREGDEAARAVVAEVARRIALHGLQLPRRQAAVVIFAAVLVTLGSALFLDSQLD